MIPIIDHKKYINNEEYYISLNNRGIDIIKDKNGKILLKIFNHTAVRGTYIIYHPKSFMSCENCDTSTDFDILQNIKDIITTIRCQQCGLIQRYV